MEGEIMKRWWMNPYGDGWEDKEDWQMTQGPCGWGGRWLDGWMCRPVGHTRLVQVHILGELLLQHVLQLLVHLSKVLVSWLH
jgi:hypothetical protein